MLRLASDADVHGDIIRGLRQRLEKSKEGDLVRTQDAMPQDTPDPQVLEWAAQENRILITNDRRTMLDFVYKRIAAGQTVPGVIVTSRKQSIGAAIEDILLIAECVSEEEIRDKVVIYLPL
jgi:hypothetical protein